MVVVTGSQGKSREWVQGSGFRVQGSGFRVVVAASLQYIFAAEPRTTSLKAEMSRWEWRIGFACSVILLI